MSGGVNEYVMGVNISESTVIVGESGFATSTLPNNKYYNTYTNTGTYTSPVTNYTNNMQHALLETKEWYGDNSYFVTSSGPWFIRGGYYGNEGDEGVFAHFIVNGVRTSRNGSRFALVK